MRACFVALLMGGLAWSVSAQPGTGILWSHTYGFANNDAFTRMLPLADGNYLAVGTRQEWDTGDDNVQLMKFTPDGETLWTCTYGDPYSDFGIDVQEAPNGELWLLSTFVPGVYGIYHTDANGAELSSFVDWNQPGVIFSGRIFVRSEGGCYLAGGTITQNEETMDEYPCSFVHAFDANGNLLWNRWNLATDGVFGETTRRTPDGGWIFSGYQYLHTGPLTRDYNFGMAKRDANGFLEWQQAYPQEGQARGVDVALTPDGGYLFVGYSYPAGSTEPCTIFLVRTEADGDSLWTRVLESDISQQPRSIEPVPDGGYLIAGVSRPAAGAEDALLIGLDADGNVLWTRTCGEGGLETANHALPLAGGYLFAGYTSSSGAGLKDAWLVRIGALPAPEALTLWPEDNVLQLRWQDNGGPYYRVYEYPFGAEIPLFLGSTAVPTFTVPVSPEAQGSSFYVTKSTEP